MQSNEESKEYPLNKNTLHEKTISFTLNNEQREVSVQANLTLADMLRYKIGVKSLKCGCERGDCGTCTILVNDKPVRSCLILAQEADGQKITTLEGLMIDGNMTPLQKKLHEDNSFQCGFCAPGMLISLEALIKHTPHPTKEEIQEAIAGNLCRCTGYTPIIDAVLLATKKNKKG